MPKRIQLQRTKGYRKPEGAVVVARPTKWGNSWRVGSTGWTVDPGGVINRDPHPPLTAAQAVQSFRNAEIYQWENDPEFRELLRRELAGRDLACWCPLDQPCHADVLLEIANGATS